MTVQLMFFCDRTGCPALEYVVLPSPVRPDDDGDVVLVGEFELPDGWGLDQNGVDLALHCPGHRS